MGACFKTLFFLVEISELPILAGQIALFLADFPILRWVPSFFGSPGGFSGSPGCQVLPQSSSAPRRGATNAAPVAGRWERLRCPARRRRRRIR